MIWEQSISDNSISISVALSLPVELASFRAWKEKEGVALEWQTASEINNNGFYIQRSADGNHWEDLGFIYGQGTTSLQQVYFFEDEKPMADLNYYRLKQEDFDGRIEYSNAVSVYFEKIASQAMINLYPVPVASGQSLNFNLSNGDDSIINGVIVDAAGRYISEPIPLSREGEIETNNLASGIYFLVLQTEKGVLRERFIVR